MSFKQIAIKNFQSHKDTEITLNDGVNIIIGCSDRGKSAIVRAILWAVTNRPLGTDDIVSHWARDEKNKIADTMSVKIETEAGIVVRKRTADSNEYVLFDVNNLGKDNSTGKSNLFEAVNKEVPEDVFKFFKLTEVNYQQQHDAPFLLSSSASDVAKYFNKIVRLDIIDTVLSNAESARRDTNKKIKETENEKLLLEKQLEDFNWIEIAQALAEKLKLINDKTKHYTTKVIDLTNEINIYREAKKEIENIPDIKKSRFLIEKIEKIEIDYDTVIYFEKEIDKYKQVNKDRKIFEMVKTAKEIISLYETVIQENNRDVNNYKFLQKEINEYTESKDSVKQPFDKVMVLKILTDIENIRPEYNILRTLNEECIEYERMIKNKNQLTDELKELKSQLPDICPLCGASTKEMKL